MTRQEILLRLVESYIRSGRGNIDNLQMDSLKKLAEVIHST